MIGGTCKKLGKRTQIPPKTGGYVNVQDLEDENVMEAFRHIASSSRSGDKKTTKNKLKKYVPPVSFIQGVHFRN